MTLAASLNNNAQKYKKELLLIPFLMLKSHVLTHMTFYTGIPWKMIMGQLLGSYELRPHDGNVNLQSGVNTKARELLIYIGDTVTDEDPEALRKSIYGAFELDDNNPSKHPWEFEILALIQAQRSEKLASAVWNGVRNNSGTTTAELFNGFDKITDDEVNANEISVANGNLLSLGTINANNAVDSLKELFLKAPKVFREKKSKMFIPYEILDFYNEQMAIDYQGALYNKSYEQNTVLGSGNMCELIAQNGKSGSTYIQLTTKENMCVGCDLNTDESKVLVKEIDDPWKTRFVTKQGFGVQFQSIEKEHMMVGEFILGS